MALELRNQAVNVNEIVSNHGTERHHLMNIVRDAQDAFGCVSGDTAKAIADAMGIHMVEVEGVVSYYHFLTRKPSGKVTIYLSKGAAPSINGVRELTSVLEEVTGSKFRKSGADDAVGLEWTSCIGMSDQEPAALVDGVVITNIDADKAGSLVAHLVNGGDPKEFSTETGDGKNSSDRIHAMVNNNIRKKGEIIFGDRIVGDAIRKLVAMEPSAVLDEVKNSNLRGRGGAGFPCGLKWDFCLKNEAANRYIVCNADEGEPGTFKDRVLLTEQPELVFEGMAVAGYVLNAEEGIMYLRAEYEYLYEYLLNVLNKMREANLLGCNIAGMDGFNFDIKIQLGAGAYVCGEETALLESTEGKRGEPRDRPPFPVSNGYMGEPTAINNVETLSAAARIIEKGADWFKSFGTEKSAGTKVLSVSGDVERPGVYEVPFGITLAELLREAGGENAKAMTVGGPSGKIVSSADFGRRIAFEDMATGGSMVVFGPDSDILQIANDYMEFFIEESCGRCTPCRVGTTLLTRHLEKIRAGRGTKSDINYMINLGKVITGMSRCGLGLTASNPVLSTIENFSELYDGLLTGEEFVPIHDMDLAVRIGREIANFN